VTGEVADERIKKAAGRSLGILIVAGAAVLGVYVYRDLFVHPRTDDAYVRANVVGIAPHVSGPIVRLEVVDNQFVREGDVLFVVDPRPYEVAVERARAALELTELEIEAHQHAVASAEAAVERLLADDAYQRDYLERVTPLLAKKFVTADQVALARSRVEASAAAVAEARAELVRARNLLGQIGDVNARRQAARAELRRAELDLGYCSVRAPFDGWVTNLNIAVGEYANQGEQVFALVDDRAWYVMANFRETFLESIRPGDRAEVYLLAYPGRRFRGTVQGIGWALHQKDGATVGILPAVEPTLNWVRLAQRFPVRIALDERDPERPFRMGATAVVTIRPRTENE
jgi:multidrug resistance efflux pump